MREVGKSYVRRRWGIIEGICTENDVIIANFLKIFLVVLCRGDWRGVRLELG